MILDDVACRTNTVVVASAAANTNVFCHRDLHVVNVVGIPQGLVELICKAQRKDVLHCFFAEVVVDPEDAVGREHRFDDIVELASRLEVAAEWLLDNNPAPLSIDLFSQSRATKLLSDLREGLRRN